MATGVHEGNGGKAIDRNNIDVSEVYSPEWVAQMARTHGLSAAASIKSKTGWDSARPRLIVGSPPPYTAFTTLQSMSPAKWGVGERKEKQRQVIWAEAAIGIHVCIRVYKDRARQGRYLLRHHPLGAG